MEIKPGSRWRSVRCSTEVIIVRAPTRSVILGCGGSDMVGLGAEGPIHSAPEGSLASGTALGKRYVDDAVGIEVLCTRAGEGALTVDGQVLLVKDSKPLPASD